jgi:hypothetical protein
MKRFYRNGRGFKLPWDIIVIVSPSNSFVYAIAAAIAMSTIRKRSNYLDILSAHADIEAQLAREYVIRCRFILTTRIPEKDVTDEGYDFNGWILEFYQEQCDGIVQIDNQGFYSPKGDLIVDLSTPDES